MSRPTIVCVPGPCHSSDIYLPLQSALGLYGYQVIPVALPSIGNVPPPYDFAEDVIAIRSVVIGLLAEQKEVIVLMHGFNGVSGSQALHGLGKLEREQWSIPGGVVRLIYIMGWVVKESFQAAPRDDVSNMFSYMIVDPSHGICTIDPAVAARTFYNDIAPQEAAYWIVKLQTQSLGIFWSKTSYAAWRHIPSTYVYCGKDQCVDEEYAKLIVDVAKEDGRHMIDTIERCADGGHCPMIGQLSWTVNMKVIRRAAGEDL